MNLLLFIFSRISDSVFCTPNRENNIYNASLFVICNNLQEKYEAFEEAIKTFRKDTAFSRHHPSLVEVY